MNVIANAYPTDELRALDAAHHLHPFTHGTALAETGVRVVTGAKGVMLTDSEGNEILDGMAGLWCCNIGHGRQELAEAAYRQMMELSYYNTFFKSTHPPVVRLSAKIAEVAPHDLNHVFYASGGSEANDTNIRLVRHYWAVMGKPEKTVIISRKNAYHGSAMGSASLGGMVSMHEQGGLPIPDICHIDQPDWWYEGGDMTPEDFGIERAGQLRAKIEELGVDRVAAFIAEPVQGAGGVIVPPETYWPEIQKICDEYDILLIADEVITGFGRTGNMFATQTYGIRPDIITIAKGLSSGYAPIGGSVVSDKVAQVINDAGEFNHGYTYSGHPVSCAVALENIRLLEEEAVVETVRGVTAPHFSDGWTALGDHPLVGQTAHKGLMGSLTLTPNKAERSGFGDLAGEIGAICRDHAARLGLVMRAVGDRMIVSPPLTITTDELDLLLTRAKAALDATLKDLPSHGGSIA